MRTKSWNARMRRTWRFAAGAVAAATLTALLLPAAAFGSQVLVIGDSLEVGTGPYVSRELSGSSVTVDALTSRSSSVGVGVLSERLQTSDDIVVFDLGVNDDPAQPSVLQSDLETASQLVGGRCLVVATLSRPPLNGVSIDGMNSVISSFAAGTPNVQVADWQTAAANSPELLSSDGIHASASGYALRGRLIADAVEQCSAPAKGSRPVYNADHPEYRIYTSPQPAEPVFDLYELGLQAPVDFVDDYVGTAMAVIDATGGSLRGAMAPVPPV